MTHRAVPLFALALCTALSACDKHASAPPGREAASEAKPLPPSSRSAAPAGPSAAKSTPLPVSAPQLAYAYDYTVEAPPIAIPALVRAHEDACAAAGPTVCQVVGADTHREGRDDVSGRLELRAAPQWISAFRARLEQDVRAAHGKVAASTVGTEDLSRSIVDTEAALRAKKTLRDRMQGLLETHKAKLDDLVGLEQQVSEIQGQIDAAESELEMMKTRVAASKLVIEYRSTAALAPDSAFAKLSAAAHGFTAHVMDGFAALVVLASYLAPFAVVGGVLLWLIRRRWPRAEPPQA